MIPSLPDGPYRIGFRVEHASVVEQDAAAGPGEVFHGTVSVTEISGSESFVHVDLGFAVWVCLVLGVHDWRPGAPAAVSVDAQGIFVFGPDGSRRRPSAASRPLHAAAAG